MDSPISMENANVVHGQPGKLIIRRIVRRNCRSREQGVGKIKVGVDHPPFGFSGKGAFHQRAREKCLDRRLLSFDSVEDQICAIQERVCPREMFGHEVGQKPFFNLGPWSLEGFPVARDDLSHDPEHDLLIDQKGSHGLLWLNPAEDRDLPLAYGFAGCADRVKLDVQRMFRHFAGQPDHNFDGSTLITSSFLSMTSEPGLIRTSLRKVPLLLLRSFRK